MTDKLSAKERREWERQRRFKLGENMMSLGNLAAGALLFSRAFSTSSFDLRIALLGLLLVVWLYVWALSVMKGGEWQ